MEPQTHFGSGTSQGSGALGSGHTKRGQRPRPRRMWGRHSINRRVISTHLSTAHWFMSERSCDAYMHTCVHTLQSGEAELSKSECNAGPPLHSAPFRPADTKRFVHCKYRSRSRFRFRFRSRPRFRFRFRSTYRYRYRYRYRFRFRYRYRLTDTDTDADTD